MILDDMRQKLIDESIVEASTGWKCYIGHAPDDQHQIVVLQFAGGLPHDTLGMENLYQSVQVRVRSAPLAFDVCYAKWREVFDAFMAPIPDAEIFQIEPLATGPMTFTDERNRTNMTMNLIVGVSA